AAGTLDGRMVDQVLLGAVRADVALERELARHDLFDGDLLFPAVAAVAFLAAWFRHFFRAAERALCFRQVRLAGGHEGIISGGSADGSGGVRRVRVAVTLGATRDPPHVRRPGPAEHREDR